MPNRSVTLGNTDGQNKGGFPDKQAGRSQKISGDPCATLARPESLTTVQQCSQPQRIGMQLATAVRNRHPDGHKLTISSVGAIGQRVQSWRLEAIRGRPNRDDRRVNRRQSLEDSLLAMAATTMSKIVADQPPGVGANDKITGAIIGCGIRGKQHARELAHLADLQIPGREPRRPGEVTGDTRFAIANRSRAGGVPGQRARERPAKPRVSPAIRRPRGG
jgi:hypothetical protein